MDKDQSKSTTAFCKESMLAHLKLASLKTEIMYLSLKKFGITLKKSMGVSPNLEELVSIKFNSIQKLLGFTMVCSKEKYNTQAKFIDKFQVTQLFRIWWQEDLKLIKSNFLKSQFFTELLECHCGNKYRTTQILLMTLLQYLSF